MRFAYSGELFASLGVQMKAGMESNASSKRRREAIEGRILAALGLTQRPLGSLELARALGLDVRKSTTACRRLMARGYITDIGSGVHQSEATWRLREVPFRAGMASILRKQR